MKLTVVVSVYNEEYVLKSFWTELKKALLDVPAEYEVIFVNDGSTDNSINILKEISKADKNVKIINFSKNFGHEAAMIAGIDHSTGDALICMDSDLQHPPEKIPEMLKKHLEGYHVVNMVRNERADATLIKKITSRLFYTLLNKISIYKFEPNCSDFFLISGRIIQILKADFRERTRFLRGFIQIVGFSKTTIDYVAPERIGGESKYSFVKLVRLSVSALATLSDLPLNIGVYAGGIVGIISIIMGIYSIIMKFLDNPVSGYTTIVVLISFLSSVQLFVMGIIGQYLAFLFHESKKRPIYIVEDIVLNEQTAVEIFNCRPDCQSEQTLIS